MIHEQLLLIDRVRNGIFIIYANYRESGTGHLLLLYLNLRSAVMIDLVRNGSSINLFNASTASGRMIMNLVR